MGAYLSEPMTSKESEDGEGNKLKFGACSMQGWRVSQEDAHNCIAKFDENSSLFSVYDGHGGAEVAIYLSRHLPEVLKTCASYKNGEFIKALEECYLKIDESIKSPEVIKEIQQIAKRGNSEEAQVDYEEENVGALYEEATMPLDKLVAKYNSGSNEGSATESEADSDCKPGSSKSMSTSVSEPGSGSNSSNSTGETACPSSSSASVSSTIKVGVNGDAKENVAEGPVDSSSSENLEKSKTDAEVDGNNANEASNSELIVEGRKIELKEVKASAEKIDNEVDSSSAIAPESNSHSSKANGINGATSDNGLGEGPANGKKEVEAENEESKSVSVNGNSSSASPAAEETKEETKANETSGKVEEDAPETPRRKKVHPTPIAVGSKPERRSPRKNQRAEGFELLDSEESDDEEDAGYNVGDSDSEVDSEEEGGEEETSDEEDDDDDDEDEYDDDEEEEEDERFLSDIQEPGYDSGSTAVVCFMKWEADGLSLWVANAGDSRCVVCREGKAIDMSHDHKPELDVEAQRIVKAGGKVTEDGRVNGGLNLSRALGDHSYKQNSTLPPEEQMISPLPSVEHIVLNPNKDKFIVLACDGIWNSMSSQEVVDFVAERLGDNKPLSKICEELFDFCLADDTCGDGTGCDNMTAIIVQLSDAPQVFSGSKRRFSGDTEKAEEIESSKKTKTEEG